MQYLKTGEKSYRLYDRIHFVEEGPVEFALMERRLVQALFLDDWGEKSDEWN